MRPATRLVLGTLLMLGAGGAAGPQLPADAVILPAAVADSLLRQCSRSVPAAYDGHWQPSAADIAALEAALPGALRAASPADRELTGAPQGWRRQYGGFLRQGHRFIYGNFIPHHEDGLGAWDRGWQRVPMMVCDGGHAFFGVEYDVAARRITHVAFNGYA